jgi:hypothetical protein
LDTSIWILRGGGQWLLADDGQVLLTWLITHSRGWQLPATHHNLGIHQFGNYCSISKWNFIKLTMTWNQNYVKANKCLYSRFSSMKKYSHCPFSSTLQKSSSTYCLQHYFFTVLNKDMIRQCSLW